MHICRHCGQGRVSRPRGLCWDCYYLPGVREQYPLRSKFHRRTVNSGLRRVQPAAYPTNALPGSLEKILVLTQRAELGQELWHPDDATSAGPVLNSKAG